jgi:hypothetical protein
MNTRFSACAAVAKTPTASTSAANTYRIPDTPLPRLFRGATVVEKP